MIFTLKKASYDFLSFRCEDQEKYKKNRPILFRNLLPILIKITSVFYDISLDRFDVQLNMTDPVPVLLAWMLAELVVMEALALSTVQLFHFTK